MGAACWTGSAGASAVRVGGSPERACLIRSNNPTAGAYRVRIVAAPTAVHKRREGERTRTDESGRFGGGCSWADTPTQPYERGLIGEQLVDADSSGLRWLIGAGVAQLHRCGRNRADIACFRARRMAETCLGGDGERPKVQDEVEWQGRAPWVTAHRSLREQPTVSLWKIVDVRPTQLGCEVKIYMSRNQHKI